MHRKGFAACPRSFLPKKIRPLFLPVSAETRPFPPSQRFRKEQQKYRFRRFHPSGIRLFPHWQAKSRQSHCPGYFPGHGTKLRCRHPRPPEAESLATRKDLRLFLRSSLRPFSPRHSPTEPPVRAFLPEVPRQPAEPFPANLPTREFPPSFRFSEHTPLSRRHPADPDRATGDNTGCAFPHRPSRRRHRLDGESRTGNRDFCRVQIHRLRLRHPNPAFRQESSTGQDFLLRTVSRKVPPARTKEPHPGRRSDASGRQATQRPWSFSSCLPPCEEILPLSPYLPLGLKFQVQSLHRKEGREFRFEPGRPCFRLLTPEPLPRIRRRRFPRRSGLFPARFSRSRRKAFPQKLPEALHGYRAYTESKAFQNS